MQEFLATYNWSIEEDPTKDYDLLLRGLRACAKSASMPRTRNLTKRTKFKAHQGSVEEKSAEAVSDCITSRATGNQYL
ncbi:unnamed protein product [Strongylus vulgaris]|uniref:Uncharacterized protein n=1 Tax=Strongylus vulgaris TaxID=40348 RepID=A0A3P7IP52_STRVU|nr:unnamed protein product [Strongylus vulgaris]